MKIVRDYIIHLCMGIMLGILMIGFGLAMFFVGSGYVFASILGLTNPESDAKEMGEMRFDKPKQGPWGPRP